MKVKTLIILILGLLVLTGCNSEARKEITEMCINESETDILSYDTLEGCKLLTCLIDNNAYDGLVYRDRLIACRTIILDDVVKAKEEQ